MHRNYAIKNIYESAAIYLHREPSRIEKKKLPVLYVCALITRRSRAEKSPRVDIVMIERSLVLDVRIAEKDNMITFTDGEKLFCPRIYQIIDTGSSRTR